MPKIAKELGAREVERIVSRGLHPVGNVAGLCLRVTDSGARGWVLRVRVGKRRRYIGLGGYPSVTLAGAREAAREARKAVGNGVDVVAQRQATRLALIAAQSRRITFAEAARLKHTAIAAGFHNAKHRKDWIASLERYAFPVLGSIEVSDIELPQVLAVLQPIWQTRTETATRVRQRVEAVLNWAIATHHRDGLNPARWKGNLEEALAPPSKIRQERHQPALPWQELPDFMMALRHRKGTAARALEFAILTAARSGEVRGMTWAEVDTVTGTWTVPGERMKAGKPHTVPLSARALELVKAQPHHLGSPYVFAAARGGQLSDMTISAVCRRMDVAAVPHGFRSSFKDWARNRTSYADEVSELALAHVNNDATRAAYARDGLLPQRARLLAEWAKFCAAASPVSASVTPIRRAHA